MPIRGRNTTVTQEKHNQLYGFPSRCAVLDPRLHIWLSKRKDTLPNVMTDHAASRAASRAADSQTSMTLVPSSMALHSATTVLSTRSPQEKSQTPILDRVNCGYSFLLRPIKIATFAFYMARHSPESNSRWDMDGEGGANGSR